MNQETSNELKKLLKWGSFVLVVLGVFLIGEALNSFKALENTNPAYNSIQVTGKGESVSIPDVATFSFTVSAEAKVVSDAQGVVTKKMDTILSELKTLGIEDKDIKTTDYSVWPKYSYVQSNCASGICLPPKQVADGYTVSHSILVKVRKTDDAGKALSVVGDKGASNISSLTFSVDNPDSVTAEARAKAIADARSKAEILAKNLGVTLVRVVGYYDNSQINVPAYGEGNAGIALMKASDAVAPTVPTGENKITSNVTVTYEIR